MIKPPTTIGGPERRFSALNPERQEEIRTTDIELIEITREDLMSPESRTFRDLLDQYARIFVENMPDNNEWPPLGIEELADLPRPDFTEPESGKTRKLIEDYEYHVLNKITEYVSKDDPKYHVFILRGSVSELQTDGTYSEPEVRILGGAGIVDVPRGLHDNWAVRGVIDRRYQGKGLGTLLTYLTTIRAFEVPRRDGIGRDKLEGVVIVPQDYLYVINDILNRPENDTIIGLYRALDNHITGATTLSEDELNEIYRKLADPYFHIERMITIYRALGPELRGKLKAMDHIFLRLGYYFVKTFPQQADVVRKDGTIEKAPTRGYEIRREVWEHITPEVMAAVFAYDYDSALREVESS